MGTNKNKYYISMGFMLINSLQQRIRWVFADGKGPVEQDPSF